MQLNPMISNLLSIIFILTGCVFFLAGTLGLLRFPDTYTRLHALTKADNIGLGLIVVGLSIQAENWAAVGKLFFIWILVLLASASVAHLIAKAAFHSGVLPWKR